jgi:hypothetical protein
MNFGADILAVRTGRATVMIGLPASLAAARGETAFGGPDASQLIDLALGASGETHGVRQFCIRCGFPSHGVAHVGNRGLRDWLVNAVRQGRLAAVLLPDVLFGAGPVQARTVEVRTDFALRTDRVMQSQAGAQLRPLELIEALQAEAEQRKAGAGGNTVPSGRAAPLAAPAGGQGRDLTPSEVRAMALEDRILEVIRQVLVAPVASANVRRQDLEALVSPNRLAGTVAVLTAWADTHVGNVRALTDLALRAFGQGGLDEEIMAGLEALSLSLARTREALDPAGLETAADRLARALTLLGPALQQLIACSTTLPVAVPSKPRALSLDRTPTRPPAERYWPRPAPAAPPAPEPNTLSTNVDAAAQAQTLKEAAKAGTPFCEQCAA